MKLFDSHCHLLEDSEAFSRAAEVGVKGLVVCGTSPQEWEAVVENKKAAIQWLPMIGIHPWFVADSWSAEFQDLEKLLRAHPEAGVGETGLDFQEKFTNRAEQEASFAAHLDLARELNRPVAVHCVRAWGRLIEILHDQFMETRIGIS